MSPNEVCDECKMNLAVTGHDPDCPKLSEDAESNQSEGDDNGE